ncbi:GntR family transcriptional regulator [Frigidibacter sp.]|uniref:GntR family transcriptional regulator n=1 Tax=Frigidibacter sp. TaxID=2586418 RepID=UPI00273639DC|nr:GntR family transcriptional regulator [Frigidibacter sp.]MDP3339312.1 GntR family transcriptional regulator [Frigidibacter sp.]
MKQTLAESTLSDDRPGVSLYAKLASMFRSRIDSGEWVVGGRIPTVEDLAKSYGAAGMTIRQALGILEAEGLIERFRAKGTFVRARPKRDLWCDVKTDLSGLLMSRLGATIEVLEDEMVDRLPDTIEGVASEGLRYRHLVRRHTRENVRFLLGHVFVPEGIAAMLTEEDLRTKTATRLVADLKDVEIADASQILTIERADYAVAQQLQIQPDFPIARVVRKIFDRDGKPLVFAIGLYRGDSVRIEMKLR